MTERNERSTLLMIELARPFETKANLRAAHERKMKNYEPLVSAIAAQGKYAEVKLHCIEVGCRGYSIWPTPSRRSITYSNASFTHFLACDLRGVLVLL